MPIRAIKATFSAHILNGVSRSVGLFDCSDATFAKAFYSNNETVDLTENSVASLLFNFLSAIAYKFLILK